MIYLDTSVALAHLLAEDRQPSAALWREVIVSSRLLEYEIWTRLHARGLTDSHGEAARALLDRVHFLGLVRPVLQRALEPFPLAVRTLDALHLSSLDFICRYDPGARLATYDDRMLATADGMGLPVYEP